jgi:hypothetical protein
MARILVKADEDVARTVRKIAAERYGGKRDALSLVVEQVLRNAISPPAEISTPTLLEIIDYVARATTEAQSKRRILANVFLMLDREFEQSIERGMRDVKEGKLNRVPRDEDPVEFLQKLAVKV